MNDTRILQIKKSIVVVAILSIGFLMPYLSRIPLAFVYGLPWIWKYMSDFEAFKWWNLMHAFSLAPLVILGLLFVLSELRWAFYLAALAHFATTCFCYYDLMEHSQRDDFLGFIVFPFVIGGASFICGMIALGIEAFVLTRKTAKLK